MKKRATSEDQLPKWAIAELRKLSKQSGVAYDKVRMMALRFGIYQTREELEPCINLIASAEALGRIDSEPVLDNTSIDAVQAPENATDSRPAGNVIFEHNGSGDDSPRPDNAGERRDEPETSVQSNEFVESLSGD